MKNNTVGWGLTYLDNSGGGTPVDFNYNYLNWLTIGGDDTLYADDPFLTPDDAQAIDAKLDDGMPARGIIHSWLANSCTTAASPAAHDATYQVGNKNGLCSLYFKY
jgi:hypothetical protein